MALLSASCLVSPLFHLTLYPMIWALLLPYRVFCSHIPCIYICMCQFCMVYLPLTAPPLTLFEGDTKSGCKFFLTKQELGHRFIFGVDIIVSGIFWVLNSFYTLVVPLCPGQDSHSRSIAPVLSFIPTPLTTFSICFLLASFFRCPLPLSSPPLSSSLSPSLLSLLPADINSNIFPFPTWCPDDVGDT